MIPILFPAAGADNTNGSGRLTDAISVVVEEERNGAYELTMTYPVSGIHYDELDLYRIIKTTAFKGSTAQLFRIYKITKPINGVVTVYAQHISYDLKKIVVNPFTASGCANALAQLKDKMVDANSFTFWTNKTTSGSFKLIHPDMARNILGGQSGSILDTYGAGDYEFDNFAVKLWLHRGSDKGVTIRYGKNLTDIEANLKCSECYAAIVPYWVSQDGKTAITGSRISSGHESDIPTGFPAVAMDFSGAFQDPPTVAQLEAKATAYLADNTPWVIDQNITVSFVNLADTEEYKNIASLETVNLCDTVHVYHPGLGITASAKVIRTKWDALRGRYVEIELGKPKVSLYEAINPVTQTELTAQAESTSNFLLDSMASLIDALSGVDSGYVVFNRSADGHINEIYIMDTDDQSTATNVLRLNYLGIYASTTGINGTYNLAITTGGTINAAQILTGILSAIEINNGSGTFHVASDGTIYAEKGIVGGWNINEFSILKPYEYDDEDNHHHVLTAYLNPPVSDKTSILTVTHKIDNDPPTIAFAINADGTARFDYLYELTVGREDFNGPAHIYGNLWLGSSTNPKQFINYGPSFLNGQTMIGTSSANATLYHYGTEYKYGSEYIYGNLYLGKMVNGTATKYGTIYTPTDHEMYFYVGSEINRSVKLSQTGGHWGLHPYGDTYLDLGLSGNRWDNIYAQNGTIQTSDKRQKKSIKALGHKALELISKLRPVSFLMRKGTSGRRHYGLIAQEVEEAMEACGMTSEDFAGLVKDEKGRYGLRYEEFIAPLILAVQDLTKRVEALEGKK